MPLDLKRFVRLRPFLYHLTDRRNLASIASDGALLPANLLAGSSARNADRRNDAEAVRWKGRTVYLCDQKPLHAGAIAFEAGWDLTRLVRHLNRHVFFWPGSTSGPIRSGHRHFERYAHSSPIVLRVRTEAMLAENKVAPRFARVNSGAPRVSGGVLSPRGAMTFRPASQFIDGVPGVVEVVFLGAVDLPSDSTWSSSYGGPWRRLWKAR